MRKTRNFRRIIALLFIGFNRLISACLYPMHPATKPDGSLVFCNPNPNRFAPGSYYSTFKTCPSPQSCMYRWLGMYACCIPPVQHSPARQQRIIRPLLYQHDHNGFRVQPSVHHQERPPKRVTPGGIENPSTFVGDSHTTMSMSNAMINNGHSYSTISMTNNRVTAGVPNKKADPTKNYLHNKNTKTTKANLGRPTKDFKVEFIKSANFTGTFPTRLTRPPVSNTSPENSDEDDDYDADLNLLRAVTALLPPLPPRIAAVSRSPLPSLVTAPMPTKQPTNRHHITAATSSQLIRQATAAIQSGLNRVSPPLKNSQLTRVSPASLSSRILPFPIKHQRQTPRERFPQPFSNRFQEQHQEQRQHQAAAHQPRTIFKNDFTEIIVVKCLLMDPKLHSYVYNKNLFPSPQWKSRKRRMDKKRIQYTPVKRGRVQKQRLPICPTDMSSEFVESHEFVQTKSRNLQNNNYRHRRLK